MKKTYISMIKQQAVLGLCMQMGVFASQAWAQHYIPGYYGNSPEVLAPAVDALPTGEHNLVGLDADDIIRNGNNLSIHQGQPRAVIHWQNFNVGSEASVTFHQENSSAKVLNRVTGDSYSKIFGSLTADGQVYILNQNGILFGSGSQVNVHSLTASALNLDEEQFINGPDFSQGGKEIYNYSAAYPNDAAVANYGTIQSGELGSVFLIGPKVENHGTIDSRGGHVGLLAGEHVEISQYTTYADDEFDITVEGGDTASVAHNFETGEIKADRGWIGMYGNFVNQDGLVRTVTALEKNGRIFLQGKSRVQTGVGSHTEALVSDSGERKIIAAEDFDTSEIHISAEDGSIEHYGDIVSPNGNVYLTAKDRIYLEKDSSIDVSGSWVELSSEDRMVEVQLNSEELRDAFLYKNGPLKGETVQVDVKTGLTFADISGYIESMEKSAPELTTAGGLIQTKAGGELIAKEGSRFDFSGGGLIFRDGLIESTKVRIGNRVYNLTDVPPGVRIDEVLGYNTLEHKRYGITETYAGFSYGGSYASQSYLPSFFQGANGGILDIEARKVVLDGSLNAAVVRGLYQNALENPRDEFGNIIANGHEVPMAGTLKIGKPYFQGSNINNLITDAIVIKNEVESTTVSADEPLPDTDHEIRVSEISADTLNEAGLGSIHFYANNSIEVEEGAELNLADLGSVVFQAKNITHEGTLNITSGKVDFILPNGVLSGTFDGPERIHLGKNSVIDVSGERLDNSRTDIGIPYQYGFTQGGTVTLIDDNDKNTGEIIMTSDSVINVSGGYTVERNGRAAGGDAGTVAMVANTVRPDGHLVGLALEGSEGGTITIHTDQVTVSENAQLPSSDISSTEQIPDELARHLVIADNRFARTGFSNIELKSQGYLTVESGVELTPSNERLARPTRTATGYSLDGNKTITAQPQNSGSTSLRLAAGEKIYEEENGSIHIEENASLAVAPGQGTISVSSNNGAIIEGSIIAHGGEVEIESTEGDVLLTSTATINVYGTALPDLANSLPGLPVNYSVVDGGKVSLAAPLGNVIFASGSLIDVSGSAPVINHLLDSRGRIVESIIASEAGSIDVLFNTDFTNDGEMRADTSFSWLPGGSLSLSKNSIIAGDSTLTVKENDVRNWQEKGFDDFSFSSRREIDFLESASDTDEIIVIDTGRGLSLNASAIIGSEDQDIHLSSHWVQLSNVVPDSTADPNKERTISGIEAGAASLSIEGDYIDIQGNIALNGFTEAEIKSANDLRLFDYYYTAPNTTWSGALRTTADLTLQAAAIYPGMHQSMGNWENQDNTHIMYPSSFTVSAGLTDPAGKITEGSKITILAAEQPLQKDIYSAGGKLILQAGDIEQHGVLAAPMGEVEINAQNRVGLCDGSVISTRGETDVLYGLLKEEQWTVGGYADNSTPSPKVPVSSSPEKSVNINATEIIQAPDAIIDVSGGGSIFAYEFLPGYDGSINPLIKNDRFVIIPDNSISMPGQTVYLDGMNGLSAGIYTVLPTEYAFLPGALIIEKTGQQMHSGQKLVNAAGYDIIAGYDSNSSLSDPSPLRYGYIVRDAVDVLSEGRFDTPMMIAGGGGSVQLNAATTILAGPVFGDFLLGYGGGSLELAGTDIFLSQQASMSEESFWQDMTFDMEIPDHMKGRLVLAADKITNKGLQKLQLGDKNTQTVTFADNTNIDDIPVVEITAQDSINLGSGSEIHALGDESDQSGELILTAEKLLGTDIILHASDLLQFNINNLSDYTFSGDIEVDHGQFAINSDVLYIQPADYKGSRGDGFYLSSRMYDTFKEIDSVSLASRSDIEFLGTVNLEAKDDLTFDAARFTVDNSLTSDPTLGPPAVYPHIINIKAGKTLRLQNTDAVVSANDAFDLNTINLAADTIVFGSGDMKFDNFKAINFTSQGDTVFNGKGSLTADLTNGNTLSFGADSYLSALTVETVVEDGKEVLDFALSDYQLSSSAGKIIMAGNSENTSSHIAMPGSLRVDGAEVTLQSAFFDMPGGVIDFQATQSVSVEGSTVQAKGGRLNIPITINSSTYDNEIVLNGGTIAMRSDNGGGVTIDATSTLDTSADAALGGAIVLESPQSGVNIDGTIKGASLAIDTSSIDDFGTLARTIQTGGFEKEVQLRARGGDISIEYADTVKTEHFSLIADKGAIDIWGKIDASGEEQGGIVEMYAQDDLTLQSSGQILAYGSGENGAGGDVFLSTTEGGIKTFALPPEYGPSGSLIDVSGAAKNGSATFRAARQAIINQKVQLAGEIRGDSSPTLQAFRVYNDTDVTSTDVNNYMTDAANDLQQLRAALKNNNIELVPEIEVNSSADLTLASGFENLNSHTTAKLDGNPGVLTFRAANNLKVTGNIIDAPASTSRIYGSSGEVYVPVTDGLQDSWGLNFVAGADSGSASFKSVRAGIGDFTVGVKGDGKLIYTESGDITFAAGNNVIIHALKTTGSVTTVPQLYMPGTDRYNLASFDGDISGYAGGDLLLEGGIIQTAVSDIDLRVGNNVKINPYISLGENWYGAIRTTGRAPLVAEVPELEPVKNDPDWSDYLDMFALERFWDYRDGGGISLVADGSVSGSVAQPDGMGWDYAYDDMLMADILGLESLEKYGAAYGMPGWMNGSIDGQPTHGVATMAGGTIAIRADDVYSQVGAFRNGDVNIYARGNLDGRFLALDGDIKLISLANLGNTDDNVLRKDTLIELGAGNVTLAALGNVSLGTVSNPAFTRLGEDSDRTWLLDEKYENSSVSVNSVLGNIHVSGSHDFAEKVNDYRNYLLPPSLSAVAGNDIRFSLSRTNPIIMAPAADGHLSLIAGRDINGRTASNFNQSTYSNSRIYMSAADPAMVYGDKGAIGDSRDADMVQLLKTANTVPDPLHIDNFIPVEMKAGRDIGNMSLTVPKLTEIIAGQDIRELAYWGQNQHADDISLVNAGRNIIQQPYKGTNLDSLYINQAGKGTLMVMAGDSIDLGSSLGISSTGSQTAVSVDNSALFKEEDKDSFNRYKGADVIVVSGYALNSEKYSEEMNPEEFADFFQQLTEKGTEFSTLMASGTEEDDIAAARVKQEIIETIIKPMLGADSGQADNLQPKYIKTGSGNIAMTQSSIKSTAGQDQVYIIAAGQIDVGTSIIKTGEDTSKGILTEGGGTINIFAKNDINVNESRIVTYLGGDIFMLSDNGNINAGRGSKTAVSPLAAGFIDVGGKLVDKFKAPAPGSGIRTLTADPDGDGPVEEPRQGAIYLIAWEGVIDAGEAGISAGDLILAALSVKGGDNITASGTEVGVPASGDAGPSLGALSGASTVSESQKSTESMGKLGDTGKELAEAMSKAVESLNLKMLVFKVVDYSDEMTEEADKSNSESKGNSNGSI